MPLNTDVTYGVRVNYSCEDGYSFRTDPIWRLSTCSISGAWEPPIVQCVGKSTIGTTCI